MTFTKRTYIKALKRARKRRRIFRRQWEDFVGAYGIDLAYDCLANKGKRISRHYDLIFTRTREAGYLPMDWDHR